MAGAEVLARLLATLRDCHASVDSFVLRFMTDWSFPYRKSIAPQIFIDDFAGDFDGEIEVRLTHVVQFEIDAADSLYNEVYLLVRLQVLDGAYAVDASISVEMAAPQGDLPVGDHELYHAAESGLTGDQALVRLVAVTDDLCAQTAVFERLGGVKS